ncbi:class I SAM-dependent methyltransferase [Streptomyces sp. NPDC047014]|uniref:class I SAM-dependent methyltransferase n=1 Tax=Streptomyces sp. NPDC047014 TaxID=3155736 RepID=UPI0033CAE216
MFCTTGAHTVPPPGLPRPWKNFCPSPIIIRMDSSQSGSQFDTAADAYEASANDLPVRPHIEYPSIRRHCGDLAGKSVLDLGCGTGMYSRHLVRWGARTVIGADISAGMLGRAREIEKEAPLGIVYLERDLTQPCACDPEFADLAGNIDLVLAVYVLCYATSREDLVAMCRTARADLRPGGRFIAPVLNPDYADAGEHPDHYAGYGFTLTGTAPRGEGSPVRLDAWFPEGSGIEPVRVDAVWWSRRTYEEALREAGFTSVTWHRMQVTDQGVAERGSAYWANYLSRPHALVIEAS